MKNVVAQFEIEAVSEMMEKALKADKLNEIEINQKIGICQAMEWMAHCVCDEDNTKIVEERFQHYRKMLVERR